MTRTTSIETYHAIQKSGLLSEKRAKVFDIFYENPKGLTGTQVSEIFKTRYPSAKHSETIRNRITELKEMGLLQEVGLVKCLTTTRNVMKFCTTDNLPKTLEKKQTLGQKISDILGDVKVFGKSLSSESDKEKLRIIYAKIKNLKK